MYFKIDVPTNDNPIQMREDIFNYLKLNYCVKFDVFKEDDQGKESHGQAVFFLSQFEFIIDKSEMTHMYDDGEELVYMTKVYSDKLKVSTSHRISRKHLSIKCWFMPKTPLENEF